eukprot:scaffold348907_cov35-Attheya_sp.AAC.1
MVRSRRRPGIELEVVVLVCTALSVHGAKKCKNADIISPVARILLVSAVSLPPIQRNPGHRSRKFTRNRSQWRELVGEMEDNERARYVP